MGNLKEAIQAYEPTDLKNISDLDVVKVDQEFFSEQRENIEGEKYTIEYILVGGIKYRVPVTVKRDLKSILEKKPDLKEFCVNRKGTTKEDTRYTVIPL